jgi:putative ABC transport system substrate-binding protein
LTAVDLELSSVGEIEAAIASFAAAGGNGIVSNSDFFLAVNRDRVIAAVNRHRLPTTFAAPVYTRAGALLGYGAATNQEWLSAAGYVDRILRGEKPRDLPVQLPTKFELAINLKTAKALGLTIPAILQATADEVIE